MQTAVFAKTLVFNSQGKLLLLKRSIHDAYRPGGWDLPGGGVEADESLEKAALRETAEETRLAIEPRSLQLVYAYTTVKPVVDLGQKASLVRLIFMGVVNDDVEPALSEEHSLYRWCSLDEAIALTDHPLHKEIFEYVKMNRIGEDFWKR